MMRAEIVSVGTELLMGEVTNTSARYLAEQMRLLGVDVFYQTTVGDNHKRLEDTLQQAYSRADIIITTGGLGPTTDDITIEVIAKSLGLPLVLDENWLQYLRDITQKYKLKLTENNKKQAYIPQGAMALENNKGTAPGVYIEHEGKIVVALPGPPYELIDIFEKQLIKLIKNKVGGETLHSRVIRAAGIGEAALEELIRDLIDAQSDPTIALYAKMGEVHIRLAAKACSYEHAMSKIKPTEELLLDRLRDHVYGYDQVSIEEAVGQLLRQKGLKLVCAESCSGGLLGSRVTNAPGASEYFLGSIVAYDNSLKENLLKVPRDIISNYGAVSGETAQAMALGALENAGADVAISITGIAGPGGGTLEKPVGTVCFGLAYSDADRSGKTAVVTKIFHRLLIGSREEVKYRATQAALYYLWQELK
ncbi:MAG: competence/damage-inducible protein A [Bacillota bacterium]|nr:competence/damage-inducible protein A [Bacillota bacterium]